jgi:hypothetical protein
MRACAPLGTAQDPFARESGLLERALLRDVLDIGAGLDPLDIERRKRSAASSRCASVP